MTSSFSMMVLLPLQFCLFLFTHLVIFSRDLLFLLDSTYHPWEAMNSFITVAICLSDLPVACVATTLASLFEVIAVSTFFHQGYLPPRSNSFPDSKTSLVRHFLCVSNTSSSPHTVPFTSPQHTAVMSTYEIVGTPNDVDLFDRIPKLEGKSNWEDWKYQFYAALNTVHPIYAKIVFNNNQPPQAPTLVSTQPKDVIRAAIKDKLGAGQTFEEYGHTITVTKQTLRAKEIEILTKNNELEKDFNKKRGQWMEVNHRAWIFLHVCINPTPRKFIKGLVDPRAAFLALEKQYAPPTWQSAFLSFEKLNELCYDGNNAMEFVGSFQEALQYMTESTGKISPGLELCLFMKSITANSRFEPVIWDPTATDLDSVYEEFIRVETTN